MLNTANETMSKDGLHAGYHNHDAEWKPIDGTKPMVVLADSTDKSIMLQLDVGTCVEAGSDPVAWIEFATRPNQVIASQGLVTTARL